MTKKSTEIRQKVALPKSGRHRQQPIFTLVLFTASGEIERLKDDELQISSSAN